MNIGMNKSGIGLKYAINNLMKDRHITFILSKTDNGDDYAMALLTKTPDGIQIDDIMKGYTTTTSIRNLIDKLIINDGFMILIINKPIYMDNMSRENYKDILDEHIQLIKISSKFEQYTDLKEKIEKLFIDDIRDYGIKLNEESITYTDHINYESTELMFQLELLISDGGKHSCVHIKGIPNIRYRYKKKDNDVSEEFDKPVPDDMKPFAIISYYKSDKSSWW